MAEGDAPVKAKPGPKPKPKPVVDVVAAMAHQQLIQDTYVNNGAGVPVTASTGSNPTVFTVADNVRIATEASGPMLIRRGQEVTNPILIHALREAGAELVPVR